MERLHTSSLELETGLAPLYDSNPDGGPEAVLFVHGNPGPMDDFESLFPPLAAFARVLAVDMPGFGRAAELEHRTG